jgi:hypothetical protein
MSHEHLQQHDVPYARIARIALAEKAVRPNSSILGTTTWKNNAAAPSRRSGLKADYL